MSVNLKALEVPVGVGATAREALENMRQAVDNRKEGMNAAG